MQYSNSTNKKQLIYNDQTANTWLDRKLVFKNKNVAQVNIDFKKKDKIQGSQQSWESENPSKIK